MAAPQPAPWSAQQPVASRTMGPHIASERCSRRIDIRQNTVCESHDLKVHVLDQLGLLNGVLDNTLNGKGSPDAQQTHQGARPGCNAPVAGRG
ncbi:MULTISPECIES: hypothetical protein [unclassified Streptomyces]|uniref:hypothetical protein n=1 Tax=unclassified Streptomyces TaxID=2593676 RepID=UPI0037FDD146